MGLPWRRCFPVMSSVAASPGLDDQPPSPPPHPPECCRRRASRTRGQDCRATSGRVACKSKLSPSTTPRTCSSIITGHALPDPRGNVLNCIARGCRRRPAGQSRLQARIDGGPSPASAGPPPIRACTAVLGTRQWTRRFRENPSQITRVSGKSEKFYQPCQAHWPSLEVCSGSQLGLTLEAMKYFLYKYFLSTWNHHQCLS